MNGKFWESGKKLLGDFVYGAAISSIAVYCLGGGRGSKLLLHLPACCCWQTTLTVLQQQHNIFFLQKSFTIDFSEKYETQYLDFSVIFCQHYPEQGFLFDSFPVIAGTLELYFVYHIAEDWGLEPGQELIAFDLA